MDVKGKLVAVTGASGMLGAYIARALLAAGARVRGVVRNPQKAPFLAKKGVEFVTADISDRAALIEAFRGCDAAVANAALYSATNTSWTDYYVANTLGAVNVYEALGATGVQRAVHLSTFVVHRLRPRHKPLTEHSALIDGRRRRCGSRGDRRAAQRRLRRQSVQALIHRVSRSVSADPRRWRWLGRRSDPVPGLVRDLKCWHRPAG